MIKHIKLGTKEVFYYDYEGDPLPLRPISSWEMDDALFQALRFADKKIAEFVVKIKLGLLGKQDEVKIDSTSYAKLKKYYSSIDYWIVYHSMKDFQKEEFRKPNYLSGMPNGMTIIRKMRHVHKISDKIMNYSYQPGDVIQEFVRDEDNRLIAKICFYLNQPLADIGNMTKLQRDFLIFSKAQEKEGKKIIEKTGDKKKLSEIVYGDTD